MNGTEHHCDTCTCIPPVPAPIGGFLMSTASTPAKITRRLVPIGDAAVYICVTRRTIERAINRGELKAYKLGKRCTRIDLNELEDLMLGGGAA